MDGLSELLMHQIAVPPVPKCLIDPFPRKLACLVRLSYNNTLHCRFDLIGQHVSHCQISRVPLDQIIQPLSHHVEILPRAIPIRLIAALEITLRATAFFRRAGLGAAVQSGYDFFGSTVQSLSMRISCTQPSPMSYV